MIFSSAADKNARGAGDLLAEGRLAAGFEELEEEEEVKELEDFTAEGAQGADAAADMRARAR